MAEFTKAADALTSACSPHKQQPRARAVKTACALLSTVAGSVWFAATASATLPAMPKAVVCPLNGESFEFRGDYASFTSFGIALDFEPLVMGMLRKSPTTVAQCKDTGLPIYRTFTPEEVEKLRSMVETPAWKERVAIGSPQYLVAYTKFVLGEGELSIANSLLRAVWGSKEQNRTFLIGKAIEFWGHLADTRQQHDQDWVAANWLRVELNRQRGEFERADYWLRDFEQRLRSDHAPITDDMIALERKLISERTSSPVAAPNKERRR